MTPFDSNSPSFLIENKERIEFEIKKYPHVVSVGIGLKEINDEITPILCYRVYVDEKKDPVSLKDHECVPPVIDGFPTDVIPYGMIEEIADTAPYRPLKGGIQIKNDSYVDKDKRGTGTLGCLALFSDEETTDQIVGLTCDHVVFVNTQMSEQSAVASGKIGQPQKVICCCCCVKNIVGEVLNSKKTASLDCAIVALHSDIVQEIKTKGALNEIEEIGSIKGKAFPAVGDLVKKRGAATRLTHGRVVDIAFDDHQILIAPEPPSVRFAGFGDSGSVVVDENNRVIGLLWGTKRDRFRSDDPTVPNEDPRSTDNQTHRLKRRVHGVATPIAAVEEALKIKIPSPPPVTAVISIHPDDPKTHVIPSTLPAANNPKQHFVTVKGEGAVVLKATFDQPVENDRIKWSSDFEEIVFPAIPGDNSTARISRTVDSGSRSLVGVTVDGYGVGEKVWVWIIWTEMTDSLVEVPFEVKTEQDKIKSTRILLVDFKIQPDELFPVDIDEKDVPDLRGPNATAPPSVPASETGVFNQGVDLSTSAKSKWDTTLSLRYKIKNPFNFFLDPQLPFSREFPVYPSSDLVGNFDTGPDFFEPDPYAAAQELRGQISKSAVIEHTLPNSIADFQGHVGQHIEFLINHKVFARLELSGTWYRISDLALGYIRLKYRVADELQDQQDHDQDGDTLDKLWIGLIGPDDCFRFLGNIDDI